VLVLEGMPSMKEASALPVVVLLVEAAVKDSRALSVSARRRYGIRDTGL
jgi:hypothetical protein